VSDLKDILFGSEAGEFDHRSSQGPSPFARAARERSGGRAAKPSGQPVTVVGASMEFRRVEALPRRTLDLTTVQDVTEMFRRPGGTMTLRPIQSAALLEAALMNGGFFPIGVGQGKSLLTLLLPTALDSQKTVLLVPPQLKKQLAREIETLYNVHFEIPLDVLTVVAYSELSTAKTADILDRLKPDLLIADESHCLKNRTSARTKRACRYLKENPNCRFVALSGTMTTRSLNDYGHLIELALRKSSPLPRGYREIQDWAGALDVKPEYEVGPGALLRFCVPGDTPRQGFRRRLTESQGVVASSEDEVGSSLVITRLTLKLPASVQKIYDEAKQSWSLDGEEFSDILTRTRVLRQIACGFYYRWNWPGGEPDYEWLEARANWNKAVREKLKQSRVGLDSPLLLANAAERSRKHLAADALGATPDGVRAWADLEGAAQGPTWDAGAQLWAAWKAVRHRPEPPVEAIWLDSFLLDDLEKRARKQGEESPTIIWVEHRAVGERLAKLSGLPYYGEGTDASPSREQIIIASIATQGVGKNLQFFGASLFASLPPNGTTFQQTIARTHRPGQLADTVTCFWYSHTEETTAAMDKIRADALYQLETTGAPQKVLYSSHINEND
jgi:hypothetical protein